MRLRTLFRVAPGAWLAPVLIALVALYVLQYVTFAHREPYALGLTARATTVLPLVVPICAAAAAWEGGRLRRAGLWTMPFARSPFIVALWAIAPAVLGSLLAVLVGAEIVLAYEGIVLPDPVVMGLVLVVLSAHAAVGFGIGLRAPTVVAVPSVLVASFLWLVLPRAIEPSWLIHLSGSSIDLCCATSRVLAPGVVSGLLTFAAGMAVTTAVLLTTSRLRPRLGILTALPMVVGLVSGGALVSDMDWDPTAPRGGTATVCTQEGDPIVCVWPENQSVLTNAAEVAERAAAAWRGVGLTVPGRFAEGVSGEAAVHLNLSAYHSRDQVISAMADGMLPDPPACAATGEYRGGIATPYLWTWFVTTAGMSPEYLDFRFPEGRKPEWQVYLNAPPDRLMPVRAVVDSVISQPREMQRTWLEANLSVMWSCDVDPPLDPG